MSPSDQAASPVYPTDQIGHLLEPPIAVFPPHLTVAEAIERVRALAVTTRLFTYGHMVDQAGVLLGIITMRDMLLHGKEERLESFMLRQPFSLRADSPLQDAMRLTLDKHFPSYPVCDDSGRLLGIVRGARMFRQETIELSAQPKTTA